MNTENDSSSVAYTSWINPSPYLRQLSDCSFMDEAEMEGYDKFVDEWDKIRFRILKSIKPEYRFHVSNGVKHCS